uniref:Retrovirus-related Pol polyprotein from transposon TNT 1-94 n=1 Tax=Tanacetum cinerariifolium TaxID=118510 RepID=A0A6L2MFG2_TANCI|nr:retrovirus-related Pol polyprotein from transposon TNT 1-94 [Tanacetum cinerariifolium]
MAGLLFRMFRVDKIEVKGTMHEVQVYLVMMEVKTELEMQIHENGVALVVEQLLFITSGQDNDVDEDVDEQPAPIAQTMFMENLLPAYLVYDKASPSYDSDILSEVPGHDNYQDADCEHHEELHSVKMQLAYTINHNKSMVEEVTPLKKDFKQKENKYLKEFLDMKALKEKVEDKLYKQDQSLQIVHMLCNPKSYYDKHNKVAIGYKNPLYLTRAQAQPAQPALYNGHEINETNHVSDIVHNSEDTLEIAEITRKKINDKMKDPECVEKKVKIAPHDYSKENYLATFTPQKQLTPEQIFWSKDLLKMEAHTLKEQTTTSRPIKVLTVKHVKIKRKNLLIANDNLITDCLSKDVFYTATDSVFTVSRFSDMHEAFNAAQKHIAELEFANSHLKNKIPNDDHDVTLKHFSKLEVQSRGNTIRKLQEKISRLTKKHNDTDPIDDFKDLDSHHKELHAKVNALHDLNEHWRAKSEKVKRHYKELYDSIKIMRAKTIDKTNSLLTEVANLKARIKEKHKSNCVTMPVVKSKVLAPATLREIVEEARVEKPLDRSLAFACLYTKHSQELVEYVMGTCPNDFNKRDKQIASTPITRKKRVTFMDLCETSTNNTLTHIKQQTMNKTDEPVIPSIGVKGATVASGSKPKSNTKKDRNLPAKSDMKKRLGHANMYLIQSLASKELVRNLPKLKFDQQFCDACKIGKQAHASHKAKNVVSTTRCLELLHMDLFGPSAVRIYGGNCYTLVIVDDYSRYTWTRFHKDKTKAFDQFEIFNRKIQNQLGCSIVSIRTDHGRQFDNETQFGEFCSANGITHNFSAPRTPQSNGMVKRKNKTLQEMSRTMLNEQSLPQKFWCNVMDTPTYILNKILIIAIQGKTPYELLRDSPDYEEDTRSSQEYMNDLKEEYQARALLAKSKRLFKKVPEVKALMALAGEERVPISKESVRNGEWIKISMKKELTNSLKIPPALGQMFVKSLADNLEESIIGSNKSKLSETEDSTMSNHDTSKHPLPPLEKLTGAEPVSGTKTIKSILKSKSTFKDETLKGITINVPSLAHARGNKGSSASKTNSSLADSPDYEEDTRSSQEYMNDLKEEYQARALLAKSKRLFKKVPEVKALMALAGEERVPISKESVRNGEWIKISMKKELTNSLKIPPALGQMFVKSLADNLEESIIGSNKSKLSETEDSTMSNHDTSKHPLPPLEKLTGAEPVSGTKTIKSILKSKSTFKDETLKGITINVPSLAHARGNKGSSASKTNSSLAGKEKLFKIRKLSLSKKENKRGIKMAKELLRWCKELQHNIYVKAELITELKKLFGYVAAVKGVAFLKRDLKFGERCRDHEDGH